MAEVQTRTPVVPAENDVKSSSFIKIAVLRFASQLSKYSTWVMMAYLTGVWKMSITKAAAVVNIWVGVAGVLPVALAFIVDSFTGNYTMLLISSVAYSCGLGLLSMSTPPPLSRITRNCREYKPECIGETQKGLFYASLALTALGIAGNLVSFEQFLEDNRSGFDKHRFSSSSTKKTIGWILVAVVATAMPILGGLILPYITTWSVRFGIPAICTIAATLVFVSGSLSYNRSRRPEGGSPMAAVYRVVVASALNVCRKNTDHLYERDRPYAPFSKLLPHSSGLSCLDKAAIISPDTRVPEEDEKRNVRLCTVTEVEVTKGFISIIPMWATFIVGGLLIAVGNTFYLEQANHMDRRIGPFKIPLAFILAEYEILKYCADSVFYEERTDIMGGIMGGMISSVVSCILAAVMEGKRLRAVRAHGLLDKPEARIPITVLWLTFQYFFLAFAESWYKCSIVKFFSVAAPSPLRKYKTFFFKGVFGLGSMASVLFTYVLGQVKPGWFQDTLNRSRFDKYFWALAALGAVNFVLYLFAVCFYPDWDSKKKENGGEPDAERMIPNEDNAELTLTEMNGCNQNPCSTPICPPQVLDFMSCVNPCETSKSNASCCDTKPVQNTCVVEINGKCYELTTAQTKAKPDASSCSCTSSPHKEQTDKCAQVPVVMVGVSDNGNPLQYVEATKRGLVAQIQNLSAFTIPMYDSLIQQIVNLLVDVVGVEVCGSKGQCRKEQMIKEIRDMLVSIKDKKAQQEKLDAIQKDFNDKQAAIQNQLNGILNNANANQNNLQSQIEDLKNKLAKCCPPTQNPPMRC